MPERILEKGTPDWWHSLAMMEAAKQIRKKTHDKTVTLSVDDINEALERLVHNPFKRIWILLTTSKITSTDFAEAIGDEIEIKT